MSENHQDDSDYRAQTVEDKIMLFALEMSGEGLSHYEIALGLWPVISYFAKAITDQGERKVIEKLLEGTAEDLRTEEPTDFEARPWMMPERKAANAASRLQHQARQEGRPHEE
jgi:hypothetical protein